MVQGSGLKGQAEYLERLNLLDAAQMKRVCAHSEAELLARRITNLTSPFGVAHSLNLLLPAPKLTSPPKLTSTGSFVRPSNRLRRVLL